MMAVGVLIYQGRPCVCSKHLRRLRPDPPPIPPLLRLPPTPGFLQSGTLVPSQGMLSEASSTSTPAAAATLQVLEAVAAVVQLLSPHDVHELLSAVSGLSRRTACRSPVRAACLSLYQKLLEDYLAGGRGPVGLGAGERGWGRGWGGGGARAELLRTRWEGGEG